MDRGLKVALITGLVIFIAHCGSPYIQGGKIHYEGGRYEKAAELFRQAIEENPKSAPAYLWYGLTMVQLKNYPEAAKSFDKVFELDPTYSEKIKRQENLKTLVWVGYMGATDRFVREKRFKKALKYVKRAIDMDPKNYRAYTTLARIYVGLKDYEELKTTAEKLFALKKESPEAYTLLGVYYFSKEKWDSALVYYSKAIEGFNKAIEETKKRLSSLLNLNESQTDSLSLKLISLHKRGEKRFLTDYIKDSLSLKPPQSFMVSRVADELYGYTGELGTCYLRAGAASIKRDSFKIAERFFEKALKINPDDYDAVYNLGIVKYQLKKDEEALKLFNRAKKVYNDDEWLWVYIGGVLINLKRYEEAISSLEKCLHLNPKNTEAYRLMALAYRDKGDTKRAFEMLKKYQELTKTEE